MNRTLKAITAILLITAALFAVGCKKEKKAEVETSQVTNLTSSSATAGGIVTSDGGSSVVERGVCWGKSSMPTVGDNHLTSGTGVGSFTCVITGLEAATTYYVRAYAINNVGIGYGGQSSFTTLTGSGGGGGTSVVLPTVVTTTVSGITQNTANCIGKVTSEGGGTVTDRGVCWSTMQNPTLNDAHVSNGTGMGTFTCEMTGLIANKVYYVRTYATNEAGTAYGNELSFTTASQHVIPEGAIGGVFTIYSGTVYFSQGNLQYIGSALSPFWKFAEHQWEILGNDTGQNSALENVDRDLFGWGTSGFSYGTYYCQPYHTFSSDWESCGYYGPNYGGLWEESDWGYNPIINGGDEINQWYTLTEYDWNYILFERNVASGIRYAKAQVNNINGVILVPDNWSSTVYNLRNFNNGGTPYTSNIIDSSTWTNTLEANGAVFLPAAGMRSSTEIYDIGTVGRYWGSTTSFDRDAATLEFNGNSLHMTDICRACGQAVRLVRYTE